MPRPFLQRMILLASLLLLDPGASWPAQAGACVRQCDGARRLCRRDAARELRRELRACAAAFDRGTGLCRPAADCRRYRDAPACRAEEEEFGAVRTARCDRIAAACTACCTETGGPCRGATLVVDDPAVTGSLNDASLSLTEAVLLATGRLSTSALAPRARRQVRGRPGSGRADRIRFVPGLTIAIGLVAGPVDSILPPLSDAGDTILGRGVRLDGGPMGGAPQPGPRPVVIATDDQLVSLSVAPLLVVSASHVEVAGLHVDRVFAANVVVAGGPGGGVEGVIVRASLFTGLGRNLGANGVSLTGGEAAGSRLTGVWVKDNRFVDVHVPISLTAGSAPAAGTRATGNVVEDVHVVGNTAERGTGGIFACAGVALSGGVAEDNRLHAVDIGRNRIVENLDVGLGVSSSCLLAGGVGNRNRVEAMRFRDNELFTPPGFGRTNSGFFVSGAQLALGAGGASDGDRVDGVAIENNIADGVAVGLLAVGGYGERCGEGCTVTGSVVEHLGLRRNTWRNVDTGVMLAGTGGAETAALVRDNALRTVEVAEERIEARASGLILQAGLAASIDLCTPVFAGCLPFAGYRLPGTIAAGVLSGVSVRASTIAAADAVTIIGGVNTLTEDLVTGMRTRDLTLAGNTIAGVRSDVTIIGGVVVTAGAVVGSAVEQVLLDGNRTPAGGPAAVVALNEVALGAPAGSVEGNTVSGLTVR